MKKPEKSTTKETLKLDSFAVTRAVVVGNTILFDVVLNGLTVYGCSVVEGKNGDFISFPSRKGKDGKYYSIVWARISDEDQKAILDEVEKKLND